MATNLYLDPDLIDRALGRHVLREAAQELVGGQGHRLALMVTAVAIAEGDGAVAAGDDGLVGDRRAMDVAAKVLEDLLRLLHDGLGEDDPGLLPWDHGEGDVGEGIRG